MSTGAPQRQNSGVESGIDHDMDALPKGPSDPEENHITERTFQPHSNLNSNPLGGGVQNRSVMWAGPDPTGAGARSEGPEASRIKGGGGASAVTAVGAARLPQPAGAGLAPPPPRPAVTPVHSVNAPTTKHGIGVAYGSAANDDEAGNETDDKNALTANVSVHDEVQLTEVEAFAIVRAARQFLVENDQKRRARKDTSASEATIRDYQKKCRQIEAEIEDLGPSSKAPLLEVMAFYAPSKQTFRALKSALRWQALEQLQTVLREQDRLQRAGQRSATWKRLVLQLDPILHRLRSIDALNRDECLRLIREAPRPSKSKRRVLHRLADDWRQGFLDINANSETYRHAGVLLAHCGLRPTELASGVRVRWTPRGVRVLIAGGKVRETAGQPWRTFLLDPAQLPTWFVEDLKQQGRLVIQADPDPLRAHLYRMSQAVLNPRNRKRDQDLILSAYLFRHALVSDLREQGWETEHIAASIGESSAATLSYYGTRRHSGSRKVKPTVAMVPNSVRTPREVKPRDKGGLKAVKGMKTGEKARAPRP